ncbi:MAG: M23 family metallopeptidase [Lachnospiraceae bacterium]
MKKVLKQIVIIAITVCIILSEWGTYGLNANASNSGLSISGASTIRKIKKGSAWTCKGTVSSNYILKEVRGTIYESDGLTVKYRKSAYPDSNTYVLQNGEIDKALLFNKLQAGVYYYTIVATDASGTTKTLVNNKFTVQGSGASTLKITGASNISSLKQGSSWTCWGTVSSNYLLREVKGTIYASDGIAVIYKASEYPNSKSYKIQNGKIDKALLFNNLAAGTYYYTIVASDASGKTLTLVRNQFNVQGKAASTLKITGASTISTLKQGKSWTCKGKVSSNYLLTEVRGTIYESDGITVKYRKSAYPNSKSYTIQNREIDKALQFNKLPGGTYHYTIVASDASGKTLTLVNNRFTVQGKAASSLMITGAAAPGTLSKGASWSCVGTVSSNYKITKIVGTIYAGNGTTKKYSKTVLPKKTSYALYNSAIDNALKFNKLAVGSYYYTITASDASGKTQVLVNERFEVKKCEKIYESPLKVKARFTTNFNVNGHRGVDLAAPKGTAIYSLADGKVIYSQYDSSYGNFIVIKHTDGMYSLYAHMKSKSRYKVGSIVKKGAKIGEVGSTGNSTGNHLHLELATGQVSGHYLSDSKLTYLVDPKQYINF